MMAETQTSPSDDFCLPLGIRAARWLVFAALLGGVLVVIVLLGHHVQHAGVREQSAVRWMTVLDLSMPALWPSGTLPRSPELVSTTVDLRLTPADMDLGRGVAVSGVLLKRAPGKDVP